MSQRDSSYQRIPLDKYETPKWATLALLPYGLNARQPRPKLIWEPACGSGKMARALSTDFKVTATDISGSTKKDFLKSELLSRDIGAIVTNPPYTHATEFIEHALTLMHPVDGMVAMLLRCDFDHAKTRRKLFEGRPFWRKIVLTKRIRWIENSVGSPSFNHAWFVWDWRYRSCAEILYHYED